MWGPVKSINIDPTPWTVEETSDNKLDKIPLADIEKYLCKKKLEKIKKII